MKFKSDIEVQAGLRDGSDDIGTAGQILSSTGSQTNWIDQSSINVSAKLVVIACKNTSGATITKGTPVYQTGTVGATDVIEIAEADASDEDKMAAIGLLQTDINNNDFGNVVITGELLNFTTDPIDGVTPVTGDTIYVKSGGGLTLTKPTGLEFIQNVGLVGKVSGGNAGSLTVSSIMRSNDVPTPLYIDHDNQRLGIGTTSPDVRLEVVEASPTDGIVADFVNSTNAGGTTAAIKLSNADSEACDVVLGANRVGANFGSDFFISLSDGVDGSNQERFRITEAGNVGIGTTSPSTDLQVIGTVRADVFGVQDDSTNPSGNTSTRVTSPAGATYDDQNNTASTGVLSVIFPTVAASTMLSFTLRVFDYANNESFDVNVAGYWYGSGLWTNTSVRIESQGNVERNFNVRFGKNNTTNKGWVGVGETTTNWSYVKFAVLNFQAAHVNDDLERWNDLWDTAVLTSLTDYTTLVTKNNNQVNNWARNGEDLYYGSGSGNVGIGTDEPGRLLELSKSVQSGQGATLRLTNEVGGAGAGVAIEFYGPGSQGIHAKIITEDLGAFDSNLIFQTKATASAGALADRLTIDNVGAIQFNDYGAGTLVTDASGNITVSSGGGAGGPYLPLTGGTLTGPLVIDTAGGAEKMTFNNEFNTPPIADSFIGNTSKSYISFGVVAGSNDPGFIMHESSSVAAYQNMGVLHLCPSDDNSTNDYVSIHGSNDPDVLKLHTSGLIETVNLQLQIKSGLNAVYVNDDLQVENGGSFGGNLTVNGSTSTVYGAYPRFNLYSTDTGEDDYSIINNNGIFGIYNVTENSYFLSLAETSGDATFAGSLSVVGDIITGSALLSNQENTDIDTGAEVVAQVAHATYTAAFFDFVVKKGTNVRSGTVYACHNGDTTPLVEFTETSTNDLGDTSDVTLSVDISGTNMRLLATVTSDDWSVKSLIRAI